MSEKLEENRFWGRCDLVKLGSEDTPHPVVEDAYNDDLFSEQHKGELQEA